MKISYLGKLDIKIIVNFINLNLNLILNFKFDTTYL